LSSVLTLRQVRELATISFNNPFTGERYHIPHQAAIEKNARYMILADIFLEGSYPSTFLRDCLTLTVHHSGAFFIVPYPLPDDVEPSNPKNLTFGASCSVVRSSIDFRSHNQT